MGKLKNAVNYISEKKAQATEKYHNWQDKTELDFQTVEDLDDGKFNEFAKNNIEDLDWGNEEHQEEAKRLYGVYNRAVSVRDNYQEMFDSKLSGLLEDRTDVSAEIEARIIELASTNPEELRKLEKKVAKVAENERAIQSLQDKIAVYENKGGKEAMEDTLKTFKAAQSWKRVLLGWTGKFAKEEMLAYEKVKSVHGIDNRQKMKGYMYGLKQFISEIDDVHQKQDRLRRKAGALRTEVLVENDIAKTVHEISQENVVNFIKSARDSTNVEELRQAQEYIHELKSNFGKEAVSGKEKKHHFLRYKNEDNFITIFDETKSLPISLTDREIASIEEDLEKAIQINLEESMLKNIGDLKKGSVVTQAEQFMKRAEFAGQTKREAAETVYQALEKLCRRLRATNHRHASDLSLALMKLKYLTV